MAEGLHSRLLYHVCMGGGEGVRDTVPKGALCPLWGPAFQPWATQAGNTASPGLVQPEGGQGAKLRTCQECLMDAVPPSKSH